MQINETLWLSLAEYVIQKNEGWYVLPLLCEDAILRITL